MASPIRNGRQLLAHLSPRRWRWRAFLRSLKLDPDALALPLAEVPRPDFVICGCPRSGTSLACATLFQPPTVVTVMEPWDGMRLPPSELFASLRKELEQQGTVSRSKLDMATLLENGTVRWRSGRNLESRRVDVDSTYALGVKWPTFARYLPLLPATRFIVCIRHPVEVLRSFAKQPGSLSQGLLFDTAFNKRLNQSLLSQTDKPEIRRALLYEAIHKAMIPFLNGDNVFVLRYERWHTEKAQLLGEIEEFLGRPLSPDTIAISEPTSVASTQAESSLIRTYCPSATALGYEV